MKTFNHNDAVILVGGSLIEQKLLRNLSCNHPVYAADSGANFLLKEKIHFEAVIGDMDSIDNHFFESEVAIDDTYRDKY